MVTAAANHARNPKEHPPPIELRQAFYTRDYGPPFTGGWREWPAGFIARMRYLESVYLTVSTYSKNHKKTDWQINNRETVNDYSRIVAIEKGEISDITVGHSYVYRLINGLLNG